MDMHPKVAAAGVGGAIAALVIGILGKAIPNFVTPEIASAITALCSVLAGWLTNSQSTTTTSSPTA